ncbi:MAG: Rab family GTPase [Promethearchaeota archaeon]
MNHDSYLLFKICLFADKDVGKETLAKSNFLNSSFEYYKNSPTGVNFAIKEVEFHEKIIRLQFWIISEDKEFEKLWDSFIRGSGGVILMYDITNTTTLNRLSEWCRIVKEYRGDIRILLVGNKLDLEENREVSKEHAEKFKEINDISSWMEISLKTGQNVEKMLFNIACLILNIDFKEMLEEKREHFIWIIDRKIKTQKEKFRGKRKLKKQQKLWRKYHIGETDSFEDYLDKQEEYVLSLAEYKKHIMNTKELPEMLILWKKVEKLLNSDI